MAGQENNDKNEQQQQQQQQEENVTSVGGADAPPSQPPPPPPTSETTTTAAATTSPPRKQATTAHKADYEPEVVYLYQLCRTGKIPSISSYCLKVETWLRVTGIKYQNVDHKMKLRSKKGQVPFVELNGAQIADSAIIVRELGKHFNRDLDSNLTREQRSINHGLVTMLENHTLWTLRWWRYNNAAQFLTDSKFNLQKGLQSRIPAGILNFVFKMKFRSRRSNVIGHGMGVHTPEEIYEFGKNDLDHLNVYIGDKSYFFGEEPNLLDIVAFAVLAEILTCQGDKFPLKVHVEEKCPQLLALFERIKQRYWPDWQEICDTLELNTHLPKPEPPAAAEEEKKDKETGKEDEKRGEKENLDKDDKDREKKEDKLEEDDNKLEEKSKEEKKAETSKKE